MAHYRETYKLGNRYSLGADYRRIYNTGSMPKSGNYPHVTGQRMAERMKLLKMSQTKLAKMVGVSQPTIFQLMRTDGRGSKHMHIIARALQTSPEYLTGETDDPARTSSIGGQRRAVSIPILLPSESILMEMFAGLLAAAGVNDKDGEISQALAEDFPVAFAVACDAQDHSSHTSDEQHPPLARSGHGN